jgi:hypothetical protein
MYWFYIQWNYLQYCHEFEGSCEHASEPTGAIRYWEVLEWLHN